MVAIVSEYAFTIIQFNEHILYNYYDKLIQQIYVYVFGFKNHSKTKYVG